MAHSILKNRFTDSLFCGHRFMAARSHLYVDLNNTYKTIFKFFVIPITRALVSMNLYIARLPLYAIRKLPFCLPGVKPVEFFFQQWQEDVQYLTHMRHKLLYSLCRLPDAMLLSWHHGIKAMIGIKLHNECSEHCECKTDIKTNDDHH